MPISETYLIDNLEYMRTVPDKFFELTVADPPYGINMMNFNNSSRSKQAKAKNYKKIDDSQPPSQEYFDELFRISKNQIIFGANHFIDLIPFRSSCWIVWDKVNATNDFADCELAWSSFNTAVRKFTFAWNGMIQGDMKNKEIRIHITQKPVVLYKWILSNYAKAGDKIFDSHLGSQSSRIAAYEMGFDFWGTELDEDYYNAGNLRFENYKLQGKLFTFNEQK